MNMYALRSALLTAALLLGGAHAATADNARIGKDWAKSGFGSSVKYKCKQQSCGGPKNVMMVQSLGSISGAPDLGIPQGSNLEAEFRRRPEVRRTLSAMLQQLVREPRNKGKSLKTSYFENVDHAGFNFTLFDPDEGVHMVVQLRIQNNKAILVGGASDTLDAARRNFNLIVPTLRKT